MILVLLRTLFSALRSLRALAPENLALRHQLDVFTRSTERPHLTNRDRAFWGAPRIHVELFKLGIEVSQANLFLKQIPQNPVSLNA